MTVLNLVLHPDDRLRAVCKDVENVDESIRSLVDDMLETMYDAPGIGLAAPQIGRLLRIAVVDVRDDSEETTEQNSSEDRESKIVSRDPYILINPEIIATSGESVVTEEGCLSIPGVFADVVRPENIVVRALNRDGETYELEASGLLSVCIQHEIDHLNGVLFLDYLSRLKLRMAMKTYRRTLPAYLNDIKKKREKQELEETS